MEAKAPLRPGLWRVVNADCRFEASTPLGSWPDCAGAIIVRRKELVTRLLSDAYQRERFVLADGLPMILQVESVPSDGPVEQRYYGLRPIRIDGDIVELVRWPATCSPPLRAKDGEAAGQPAAGPAAVKGLMVDDEGRCRVNSPDQLRAAVLASEDWDIPKERLLWVRAAP